MLPARVGLSCLPALRPGRDRSGCLCPGFTIARLAPSPPTNWPIFPHRNLPSCKLKPSPRLCHLPHCCSKGSYIPCRNGKPQFASFGKPLQQDDCLHSRSSAAPCGSLPLFSSCFSSVPSQPGRRRSAVGRYWQAGSLYQENPDNIRAFDSPAHAAALPVGSQATLVVHQVGAPDHCANNKPSSQ